MYLILALFFSVSAFSNTDISKLAHDPKWIRLLHYKKTITGNYVSEADGKSFFLHKDGKSSPVKELEKTIAVFNETIKPNNEHPICQLPLRFKWLNQQLGMQWKVDLSGCTRYIEFFSKFAAKRASIVFSSYYLSNPSSAFGHTLLRFSRYDDVSETEMLDYGVNYSAEARENNPLLYALKGFFGGFKGKFAVVPYYYKIREYSNFEFRDVWSYDLKLTMPQVLEMVDHIWELGHTDFDYYYLLENCSYQLLSIIEVALPHKHLTNEFEIFAIPGDTIRLLAREGLIDEGKRRESTYSKLVRLSKKLDQKDLHLAKAIVQHPGETSAKIMGMNENRAADILDVSMEAFDYYNFEKVLKDDPKTNEIKSHLLRARAFNPVIFQDVIDPKKTLNDSPALGHSPTRLTLAQNYFSSLGKSTRFEIRPALHDLLDPPKGSLKTSQLEMGKISFEWQENKYENSNLILDYFSIVNLRNFLEQNFWSSPLSWEIDAGAKQLKGLDCFNCPAAFVNGSIGNSLQLTKQKVLMAFLMNGEVDLQSQFENNYRLGIGPKIFTRFKFSDKWIAGLSSTYHFNTYEHNKVFQDYEWASELELRHHLTERISLTLKGGGIERDRVWQPYGEFGLQYFYE